MANIIELKDFSAPELNVYARLTEAQLRNRRDPEKGLFIAESPKVIHVALNAGYEPQLAIVLGTEGDGLSTQVIQEYP